MDNAKNLKKREGWAMGDIKNNHPMFYHTLQYLCSITIDFAACL